MAKRVKLVGTVIKSRAEAEAYARDVAEAVVRVRSLTARMDKDILAVREIFESDIEASERMANEKVELLRAWADANPNEFGDKKSIDMLSATIGYRTGTPKLKTLSGWTWDRVLETLLSLPTWAGFVRIKHEVDKERIIAMRDSVLPGDLRVIGVRLVQEETFFVEPKLSEQPDTVTA